MDTIGSIAERLGESRDTIAYLIRTRQIRHTGRAGLYRLYDEDRVEEIEKHLKGLRRRRRQLTPA